MRILRNYKDLIERTRIKYVLVGWKYVLAYVGLVVDSSDNWHRIVYPDVPRFQVETCRQKFLLLGRCPVR